MKRAIQRDVAISVGADEPAEAAPRLALADVAGRFRPEAVSTLTITVGEDGAISHRIRVLPEHRQEVADWLIALAHRIGAPD
ncbi:hypothetical protein [Burkholderia sp. 22PA0106]|uniref:hypothetical protein n=1 Tax=Burkholderia sp. 22PA0106 TaxID=3237371 RepID=UPI0039C0EBEA